MTLKIQPPPFTAPIVGPGGSIDLVVWTRFLLDLNAFATGLQTTLNAVPGVQVFTVGTQPSLGVGDAGAIGFMTDFGHYVRWTGAVWTFAPGDVGNGFFRDFAVVPQEVGWKLCDGTATTYLAVGAASLTATAITPPNLNGTPSYRKSASAYTGTLNAVSGSTATGSTGTGTTSVHHVDADLAVSNDSASQTVFAGVGTTVSAEPHTHSLLDVTGHSHTVPALSVPALAVGTIDMPNLATLVYFRR